MDIIISIALALVLVRLSWIDFKIFRLPDLYTLPLIAAGFCIALTTDGIGLTASLIGGGVGYALFWAVGYFYFQHHQNEGLGLGDAKLFAASGTWLGYAQLPYVLMVASFTGLLVAVFVRRHSVSKIAFGPWLCLGFFTIWIATVVELL